MSESELQKAVNKLVAREPGWLKVLPGLAAAQPIGPTIGVGKPRAATKGTGGISSPLTEVSFASRQYYPAYVTSTDGMFSFQALKSATFVDAAGAEVQLIFAQPA